MESLSWILCETDGALDTRYSCCVQVSEPARPPALLSSMDRVLRPGRGVTGLKLWGTGGQEFWGGWSLRVYLGGLISWWLCIPEAPSSVTGHYVLPLWLFRSLWGGSPGTSDPRLGCIHGGLRKAVGPLASFCGACSGAVTMTVLQMVSAMKKSKMSNSSGERLASG